LVDYDTETVLAELAPLNPTLASVSWRFAVGPVPAPPVEPPATEAPAKSAAPGQIPPETASAPLAPVKVPANITEAAILSRTTPEYPARARAAHIQGDVVLRAIIDKEGKISEVHVLSGDELLAEAAVEAVKQWRYKPMFSDGQPAEVETTITVTFSLQE
ncbi:MAG: energy transducer TonB, partial [Candidatus Acidiferrales bacterium]